SADRPRTPTGAENPRADRVTPGDRRRRRAPARTWNTCESAWVTPLGAGRATDLFAPQVFDGGEPEFVPRGIARHVVVRRVQADFTQAARARPNDRRIDEARENAAPPMRFRDVDGRDVGVFGRV